MPDQKPPRSEAGELETVSLLLQYQRDSFVRKIADLDDPAARRQFVESGTTLLWLVRHLAYAERLWIVHRFAGEDIEAFEDTRPDHTLAAAIDEYGATWAEVDAIVAASSLDESCRRLDSTDAPVNLRWVLMHLLEETARHAGHADILRELIDGQTGR